jgi:beta-1,4-N-acetylglucosaminyltransferase
MRTELKNHKIGIITSRGGHLFQMYQLKEWWQRSDRFWVTLPGSDVSSLLEKERIYYAHGPESRNVLSAILNLFCAIKIMFKEKPSLLISCGAGIAPPFFYIGKLFGVRLVFIEPFDFIQYPSLSGKLVEPIVDELLVQHTEQLKFFKHAIYKGSLL